MWGMNVNLVIDGARERKKGSQLAAAKMRVFERKINLVAARTSISKPHCFPGICTILCTIPCRIRAVHKRCVRKSLVRDTPFSDASKRKGPALLQLRAKELT